MRYLSHNPVVYIHFISNKIYLNLSKKYVKLSYDMRHTLFSLINFVQIQNNHMPVSNQAHVFDL